MTERVIRGHLGPVWDDDFKYLPYRKQPVSPEEVLNWRSQGYDFVKSFTGTMYDNSQPMPKWIRAIEGAFGLYKQTYTFYRMSTLEIMPTHSDHFRTYCKLNDVDYDDVWRAVLMLEDWKPGHYFELNGVGYVNWKSGDWFMWQGDIPHAASNIGIEDRYTLQITGTTIYTGQLNDLFCLHVPNVRMRGEMSHPHMRHTVLPKLKPGMNPVMFYMDNSRIKKLETIEHTPEGIEQLNERGLSIYLYEPICSYKEGATPKYEYGTKHTQGFYSEFSHDINPSDLRAEELDSILEYVKKWNLNNVIVHTGDYDIEKWYPHYTSHVKLITDDLFLKTQVAVQNLDAKPQPEFTKRFLNLNWRFTKHRQLLATYLSQRDAHVSWYFKSPFDVLKQDLFFDLDLWQHTYPEYYETLKRGTDYINETAPLCLDTPAKEAVWINHPHHINMWPSADDYDAGMTPALFNGKRNTLETYYKDIFVDVVNETRFAQPTANFSEKVFQAIQYYKPFIVAGPPRTLEYVRSLGFLTFSEFWDESYDLVDHHGERLAKIFELIDWIENQSIEDLQAMYKSMLLVLEHNKNHYMDYVANPNYNMKKK
jgi:hypothetical protein